MYGFSLSYFITVFVRLVWGLNVLDYTMEWSGEGSGKMRILMMYEINITGFGEHFLQGKRVGNLLSTNMVPSNGHVGSLSGQLPANLRPCRPRNGMVGIMICGKSQ